MKRHWLKIAFLLLVAGGVVGAKLLLPEELFSVEHVKQQKEQLLFLVESHYSLVVLVFVVLYIATAFFLPGALALTVAGGMMFGPFYTVIYAGVGATVGALLAFMAARYVFGGWVQERFQSSLERFNEEMSRHGQNYLLILRILPVAPFFVINYCAGITKMPVTTFVWTTALGMLPGAFLYAFIGGQLRHVNAVADVFSWKILLAFALLAFLALLPVLLHHLRRGKKGK